MWLEHRLSALLQLNLHSLLNARGQLQDQTVNIYVLRFGAPYIRDLTVIVGAVEISYTTMRYCLIQQSCSVYCLYPCLLDNKKLKKKKKEIDDVILWPHHIKKKSQYII